MKSAAWSCLAVLVLAGVVEAREWTDAKTGRTIEADFVRRLDDKVVLRMPADGKLYTVPLSRLSDGDRAFVESAKEQPGVSLLDQYAAKAKEVVVDTSGDDRWSAAIRSDPNNPTHYIRRGMASTAKGSYEDAILDYSKAINLEPKAADAYSGRGKAYSKAGEPVKAHDDFNKAISVDEKLASAYRNRADNFPALAKTEKGQELLEDVRSELKKKWSHMAADNNKVSPWQPLNSTKGPMTADQLALGLAKRDYEYAELLAYDNGLRLGLGGGGYSGGVGVNYGGGVSVGAGAGVGAAVGVGYGGQAALTVYPEVVVKGEPLTLIADLKALQLGMPQKIGANGRPVMSGGKIKAPVKEGVEAVDFYRDIDGDGKLSTDKDQYLGTDGDPRDGFSIEAPSGTFALGENIFFAEPRGAEGTDAKAGPDYNTVADKLEKAAKQERAIAAEAAQAEAGLTANDAKALRDDQRGVQSVARSVMKDLKASSPETYESLKEVSRGSLAVDKELASAEAQPGAASAESASAASAAADENAGRLEEIAKKLRELSSTQSTAARGVAAYAPGKVMPAKNGSGGPGKGGPGNGGDGDGGDGDGGGGDGGNDGGGYDGVDRYADYPDRADRAVDYIDRGDYDRAVVEYDRLLVDEPENDYYLRQRAGAHLARGGYDYAIRDFDRLVDLDVKNADLYYNRGCAHLATGDISNAIADFDISISLDETRNLAFTNRGVAYARAGKYEQAVADFNRAISLKPTDTLAYRNRALAFRKLGKQAEAEADVLKLKELSDVTLITP